MTVKGEIIYIIHESSNGYKVIELNTKNTRIVVNGMLPFVELGDYVRIEGDFVQTKYGEQIKAKRCKMIHPESLNSLRKYLGSGKIKGIRNVTAEKIVEKFQMDSLEVIKNSPEQLATIHGISTDKAIKISENFKKNEELWELVDFLDEFGVGQEYCKKVIDILGDNPIEQIKKNPYVLTDISNRVSFKKIDEIALSIGYDQSSELRVFSAIKYVLGRYTLQGHCFVEKTELLTILHNEFEIENANAEKFLKDLVVGGEVIIENVEGKFLVYLQEYNQAEKNVARRLIKIRDEKSKKYVVDIDDKITQLEENQNFELSEKQRQALKTINENNLVVITGGPGTGKTTIIKNILELYDTRKTTFTLAAPTGRAAKRMSETTDFEASTLHRLLEIGKLDDETTSKNIFEVQALESDIVIIDEMSMVDIFLMNYLLDAVHTDTKLILVGDVDQLNSVGPGNVLKDIINSGEIETIRLDKVFRQASKSKIIQNAHRVNCGKPFLKNSSETAEDGQELNKDFYFLNYSDSDKIYDEVLDLCSSRLDNLGYDFFQDVQILSPTKKGRFGTVSLNQRLQEILNPEEVLKKEIRIGDTVFREGDRVMQIKNDYNLQVLNNENYDEGVFNGEVGIITEIEPEFRELVVTFEDGKMAIYTEEDLSELSLAYATTIHKAQGSEYDVVIMVVNEVYKELLTRNLLYTGITRAKKLLLIFSNDYYINYMLNNVDSKKRNTTLSHYIKEYGNTVTNKNILSFLNIKKALSKKDE